MKYSLLFLLASIVYTFASAQDISGYWQGVLNQENCGQISVYYPFSLSIQQDGDSVKGEFYLEVENTPYYAITALENALFSENTGRLNILSTYRLQEVPPPGGWCINFTADLLYDEPTQSLIGSWEADPGPDADICCPGTIEIYRLQVLSDSIFCPGEDIEVSVTGQNIRWYADRDLTQLVGSGNDFSPLITQTTTYYVTQTHYNTQSPAFPVRIIIDPQLGPLTAEDTDCGAVNGSVTVEARSEFSLEYSIDGVNFQAENVFEGLSGGSYTVQVRNEFGCTLSETVAVNERPGPEIISLETTDARCNTDNGSVSIVATGGTSPISYSLDGTLFTQENRFEGLAPGTYTLRIQDQNGCGAEQTFDISSTAVPEILEIQATEALCREANGEIAITGVTTTGVPSYALDDQNFQPSPVFANLSPGTYTVYLEDGATGCRVSSTIEVPAIAAPSITDLVVENASCLNDDGQIRVAASGGMGQLLYALENQAFQTMPIFTGLSSGNYLVTIRDDNNCEDSDTLLLKQDDPLVIDSIGIIPSNCESPTGQFTLHLRGGKGQRWLQIENAPAVQSTSYDKLMPQTYDIAVFDESGCQADTTVTIPASNCPLFIPKAFSPNGDGINDYFTVVAHPLFQGQIRSFKIFNRWGKLVVGQTDPAPSEIRWDGQYQGRPIQETLLIYQIELAYPNGKEDSQTGSITLIR